jgi:hypothetical protein
MLDILGHCTEGVYMFATKEKLSAQTYQNKTLTVFGQIMCVLEIQMNAPEMFHNK